MITLARSVNFGATKGSLATVGYTLKNYDGSEQVARISAGVTEIVTDKGVYAANIDFPDAWSGFVVWDTGEGSPLYAVDQFDYRHYQAFASVYPVPMVNNQENKADLDKILRILKKILVLTQDFKATQLPLNDNLKLVLEGQHLVKDEFSGLKEMISSQKMPDLSDIREGIIELGAAVEVLLEANAVENLIQEIENA